MSSIFTLQASSLQMQSQISFVCFTIKEVFIFNTTDAFRGDRFLKEILDECRRDAGL